MKKQVRIGDVVFGSKSKAEEAIRKILYAYPVGATVKFEDAQFLADLLDLHPERDAKVGVGARSFQIEQNGPTRGFWLTRTDGSRTDFSFKSCLTPPTAESDARAGFRSEVRDQIAEFRALQFAGGREVRCPITGESVNSGTSHVDHVPPFEDLVRLFLSRAGLSLSAVGVEPTRDGETETRLADRGLGEAWAAFHRQHAGLRIVSVQANLSLLRRRA
jgi:hypothetical protein